MRIAILNNNKNKILNEIEKNYHLCLRIKVFKSIDTLTDEIKKFDVIITDVIYDEKNIIHLVKKSILDKTYVIFVTEHKEMMKECFGMNIISFLLLSEINEISPLLNMLDRRISKEILIDNQEKVKWINLDKVMYIEYSLRDLYFHLDDGKIEKKINVNLNSIINELDDHYVMINRMQIVNLLFIEQLKDDCVEMKDGHRMKVSVRRKKDLNKKFKLMKGK